MKPTWLKPAGGGAACRVLKEEVEVGPLHQPQLRTTSRNSNTPGLPARKLQDAAGTRAPAQLQRPASAPGYAEGFASLLIGYK